MLEWIVSSTVLTAIVIVLRFIFKGRMRLRLQYALWLLVLVRLLVPLSFGSTALSVQNVIVRSAVEAPKTVYTAMNTAQNGELAGMVIEEPASDAENRSADRQNLGLTWQVGQAESQNVPQGLRIEAVPDGGQALAQTDILMIVWAVGAGLIALWLLATNLRFYGRLRRSRELLELAGAPLPVYVTDKIDTPCLFGVVKPKIYVTPEVAAEETALRYSVEHEATHRSHGDHIWSILRGACLAVHWFNPLVWVAAILSRNDAELACDEATIQRIGEEHRAAYGRTLIHLTCEKRPALFVAATTMTGSGRSIKERIQLIVKQPKTAVYTLIAIVLVIAVAVGCTFTGAKTDETEQPEHTMENPGDTELPKAEQDIPADATVIGQAVYGGYLYDVPDVTTGIAFEEKQEFIDAVLIPPTETPTQSLECNVPGKSASFAVVDGELILIVDGTQYVLANAEKIIATTTPIGRHDLMEDPDEQLVSKAWQQAEAAAGEIGYDIAADRYTCNTWGTSKDVIFADRDGTRSLAVSFEKTADGEWTNTPSGSVIAIDGGRLKDLVSVSDEIMNAEGSDRIAPVIDFARDYTAQCAAYWNERTGNQVAEAVVTGLTKMNTGTAALEHEITMYQLEYRLLPEGQEQIVLAEGMQTEEIDGKTWITEQAGGGQPYLLLVRSTSDLWQVRLCAVDTATIERNYGTPEMLDHFGRAETAAAMMLFNEWKEAKASIPTNAVQSLFASGDAKLTLYLEDGSAWHTYSADGGYCAGRMDVLLQGFLWMQLDTLPSEQNDCRIVAVSADGTKQMTFRSTSVEYSDGVSTSVWGALPLYAENASVVESIREIYNNLDVAFSRISFYVDGGAEQAAEYFATTAVGEHMRSLAPGSGYGADDYEVIEWRVNEISEDGKSVKGVFSCAFVPWYPESADIRAGNTHEGTGKYAGKLVFYRSFSLQQQEDGKWHCTEIGTG